jgi:hypothetical protein
MPRKPRIIAILAIFVIMLTMLTLRLVISFALIGRGAAMVRRIGTKCVMPADTTVLPPLI